jgi:diguanylate cyclase
VLPAAVAVVDRKGVVVAANALWRQFDDEAGSPGFLAGEGGDERVRALVLESIARVGQGRSPYVELEVPDDGPDGRRWDLVRLSGLGRCGAVVMRIDVTRSHDALDVLAQRSLCDSLTGLPNRSLLEDRIASAVARAERGTSAPVLLFMDLDRFKAINDTHGHSAGDAALVTVTQRLGTSLRAVDTFGRWGGDEFVAIIELPPDEDPATLTGVVDRVIEAVGAPLEIGGTHVEIGISIGAALIRPGDNGLELVGLADAAMYHAKQANLPAAVTPRDTEDVRLSDRSG